MPEHDSDKVMCMYLPVESFEMLQGRAADCGMSVNDYVSMALNFVECLPAQMLIAWRSGVLNIDMLEG